MDIFKFASIAVAFSMAIMLVKNQQKEIGTALSIACGLVLLSFILSALSPLIAQLKSIFQTTKIDVGVFLAVLKIIGIAYIAEFSATVCEDAENKSLAIKVRLFGKLAVLTQTLPLLLAFIKIIGELM